MRLFFYIFCALCCLPVFADNIPNTIFSRMQNNSWKKTNAVAIKDLVYLRVKYWGFDDKPHIGEIIVHKRLEKDMLDIFNELFSAKFPIEKIRLIDDYAGNDELSMTDNNSSAFCTRPMTGKKDQYSKHSYGIAIDINPVQNPYVKNNIVAPKQGRDYLDRNNIRKGMIIKGDVCYKAFVSRGFTWGGEWTTLKDYQHFEINLK
jgi:hypothetical protein